jgi:hypothetical protein
MERSDMSGKYDDECYYTFGMDEANFLEHGMNYDDPIIHRFAAGTVCRLKDGPGCYLVVDCNALPGIRIAGVWDKEDEFFRFLEKHRS